MDLKKPASIDVQIDRLKAHGYYISDEDFARQCLEQVNYYRFTGYTLQFRKEMHSSDLASQHDFNDVFKLYEFDRELRHVLRKYLEIVEVYYKTQIATCFSLEKCISPPYDQHYDRNNYYNKEGFDRILEQFEREQGYYKDSLIVKHHDSCYGGRMPLWVMFELMSFSHVSMLYSAMYNSSKVNIAKSCHVGYEILENHLRCLSVLRNKVSHAARLLNTHFNPPAKLSRTFLRNNPSVSSASMFAYILILKWRMPTRELGNELRRDIFSLIDKYADVLDLSLIGFPQNYKSIL